MMHNLDPVSTCVITGLTGTGKSTLVRSLLLSLPSTARVAVCVHQHAKSYGLETTCPFDVIPDDPRLVSYNEVYDFLGPTQITDAEVPWPIYPGSTPPNRGQSFFLQRMHMDDSLVHDRADFGSGCICCSPDGDLTRALVALGAHREAAASRGDMHAITHAIVETTGLADPRPFTRLIGAEHVVSRHFSLDRVVCVIDPSSILSSLAEPRPDGGGANKATEQLRNSDAIIINGSSRSDKGVETSGEEAEDGALEVNPLLHVVRGMADKGRGVSGVTWQEMMGAERERGRDHLPCGVCEDEDEYIKVAQLVNLAGHDRTYSTGCCVERGGVIWSRAEAWIKEMLQSGEVLQIKGFVSVQCERDPTEEAYIEALSLAHPRSPLSRILTISAGGAAQTTSTFLHIEAVEKDGEVSSTQPRKHPAMANFQRCRDTALLEHGTCKLFVLATGLRDRDLGEELRMTMVPASFVAVADLDLDFPQVSEEGLSKGGDGLSKSSGVVVELEDGICGIDENGGSVEMGGIELAVYCVNGRFYATAAYCANGQHMLHNGQLSCTGERGEGGSVQCAVCGACFGLRDGRGLGCDSSIKAYPVRVAGNLVYVGLC